MSDAYKKYRPQAPQPVLRDRKWPSRTIENAPFWCSVDLRDGNQALIEPMGIDEKLRMFSELVRIGFKEIEIGFPSANDTEFEFTRTLIEGGHIPDDVTIQVLVQAREHLIRRTFEAIKGAKNVIVHMYNATSEPVRRIVFDRSKQEVIDLAVEGARLIRSMADELLAQQEEEPQCSPRARCMPAPPEVEEEAVSEAPADTAEPACDALPEDTAAAPDVIIEDGRTFYPIPPAQRRDISTQSESAAPSPAEEVTTCDTAPRRTLGQSMASALALFGGSVKAVEQDTEAEAVSDSADGIDIIENTDSTAADEPSDAPSDAPCNAPCAPQDKMNRLSAIRYEYSPEFFSATEPDFAVEICAAVMDALGATAQQPVILNLPASVENCMPNVFADQIEYFCEHLPRRSAAIISVHSHNDRGTGVAAAELALLAGAQRVEGTLFGNGERTGNCDLVTMALNMMTQGIDPQLDFSELSRVRSVYERCTHMHVGDRQPYSGDLVFTAFSGSHQDAINKGMTWQDSGRSDHWEVPYLPVCPADLGRQYEPIIRINSQSGKGGAAFVLQRQFGYILPRDMHPEFGMAVKRVADERGCELSADDVLALLHSEYIDIHAPYSLRRHSISDAVTDGGSVTTFGGVLECHGNTTEIEGRGNGPIDAFFDALRGAGIDGFSFVSYHEHGIGGGSDAQAVAYIELRTPDNRHIFGVGVDPNINLASIKGVLCAVNRAYKQ